MNTLNRIIAATVLAAPLIAFAQTPAVVPADQPRSELERKQTTDTGQATKYGGPGTNTGGSMGKADSDSKSKSKSMSKTDGAKGGQTAPGDVPTYPAPAKDGTPTK